MKNKTSISNKQITIDGSYSDITTFYHKNKKVIYDSIVERFSDFILDKNLTESMLTLSTKIEDEAWDTELIFKRADYIILKRDLMPFYEEIEDYETCNRILELQKLFTK